jgi:hypothetical protein
VVDAGEASGSAPGISGRSEAGRSFGTETIIEDRIAPGHLHRETLLGIRPLRSPMYAPLA